ncbi:hypothetical protein GW17_00047878, partial [Ensete ventricosum]
DIMGRKSSALLLTDDVALPLHAILSAVRDAGAEAVPEDDVVVITQCESLGNQNKVLWKLYILPWKLNWMVCLTEGKLPIMTASLDVVVTAWNKPELVGEQWLQEIGRVLKPGGELILQSILFSCMPEKVAFFCNMKSTTLAAKLHDGVEVAYARFSGCAITGNETFLISWKCSVHYSETLLSLPYRASSAIPVSLQFTRFGSVGDCEVGSTRKACKNCTCGRAQEEEKLQKVGLTTEQINNPQSACGSVCDGFFILNCQVDIMT